MLFYTWIYRNFLAVLFKNELQPYEYASLNQGYRQRSSLKLYINKLIYRVYITKTWLHRCAAIFLASGFGDTVQYKKQI